MADEDLQDVELPSDASLFDDANKDTPAQTEQTEQPRGPDGKFAAKEAEKDEPTVEAPKVDTAIPAEKTEAGRADNKG